MGTPIASLTRLQIRQSIGYGVGGIIVSTATINATNTTMIDTYALARGADDEYNNGQIMFNTGVVNNVGTKRFVSDFVASTKTFTFPTALAVNTVLGDGYEYWLPPLTIEDVNQKIADAETEVMPNTLIDKIDSTVFTECDKWEYPVPTGFVAINEVEYVSKIPEGEVLDTCDTAWTAGDSNITVSLDDEVRRFGSYCNKFVVADALATDKLIATHAITEVDLSNYDTIEFWIFSSVATAAGDLKFQLDDTALCASVLESISLPALTANTWTRCVISLANPASDTAIISVGLYQDTDIGACTIWFDYVLAYKSASRVFLKLNREQWETVKGSTTYLKLTPSGKVVCGNNAQLRITGYKKITPMTTDALTSEVDPYFIINRVTGALLSTYALRSDSDPRARLQKAQYYLGEAERARHKICTSLRPGTIFL